MLLITHDSGGREVLVVIEVVTCVDGRIETLETGVDPSMPCDNPETIHQWRKKDRGHELPRSRLAHCRWRSGFGGEQRIALLARIAKCGSITQACPRLSE